jgi:hypothetical protein
VGIESSPITDVERFAMSVIVDHDYIDGVLRFRMVTGDERTWVLAEEVSDDTLVRNYWERVKEARARELPPIPPTLTSIREPTRLIEIKHYLGETFVLSEFDGCEVPVLVPIKFLENGYTQKLIDFLEAQVTKEM